MAEVPVEAFRQSRRYEMTLNRRKIKHEENDMHRSLADLRLADVDLSALANKLKNKAEVNVTDLRMIKNLLIQDENNIKLVLSTEGALRGLVRELSGVDMNRQVEAAGCLCNLALADQRGCLNIIRVAGAYLTAALDSHNLELARVCAWTLGNLCGAGAVCAEQAGKLGVVGKLCSMLRSSQRARVQAASCALTLYAHAAGDLLKKKHLELIVHSAGKAQHFCMFRLVYIVSCHRDFSDPGGLLLDQLQKYLPHMMRTHHTECVAQDCCEVVYVIRTLANMEHVGAVYFKFLSFIHADKGRRRDFLDLLKDPRLKVSMLWLLGNMSWRQQPARGNKRSDAAAYRPQPSAPDMQLAPGGEAQPDFQLFPGGLLELPIVPMLT